MLTHIWTNRPFFLVWDCHDLGLKNCRSLILDTKRGIIIGDKETTRLVNQFIKQQPVGLLLTRALVGSFAKNTMSALCLGKDLTRPFKWLYPSCDQLGQT